MALIISDPTTLVSGGDTGTTFAAPITFDVATKTITITPGSGILADTADGVTGQALYSAAKIVWKNSDVYIKYPFPMEAITPESFEFINGWVLANDTTRKSLRTCGWAERGSTGGAIVRKYMGIVSLGTLGTSDFSYYAWNDQAASITQFDFPGPINEGIQIYGDASNGNFDFSDGGDSLKLFNRIQGKVFSNSNNTAIGALTLGYITYRFPLSNATDLNIAATDSHIAGLIDSMTGLAGTGSGTVYTFTFTGQPFQTGQRIWIQGATPATLNGVQTITASDANSFSIQSTETTALSAITSISSIHAAVTIDYLSGTQTADVNEDSTLETYKYIITDAVSSATTREVYEKLQYLLRQGTDISTGATTVIGSIADTIMTFVGSTLSGEPGVYISGIADAIKNFVEYYELTDTLKATKIVYPFIASGTISFGSNAGSGDFQYWLFYKTLPLEPAGSENNDYGQANARIVNDALGNPIAGTYSGTEVSWSFKYDSEVADYGNGAERAAGVDAPVIAVGIGLDGGQFISVESTIRRATGQNILVAPALERNYQNPA